MQMNTVYPTDSYNTCSELENEKLGRNPIIFTQVVDVIINSSNSFEVKM